MDPEVIERPKEPSYDERLAASKEIERLRDLVTVMERMSPYEKARAMRYLNSRYPCFPRV